MDARRINDDFLSDGDSDFEDEFCEKRQNYEEKQNIFKENSPTSCDQSSSDESDNEIEWLGDTDYIPFINSELNECKIVFELWLNHASQSEKTTARFRKVQELFNKLSAGEHISHSEIEEMQLLKMYVKNEINQRGVENWNAQKRPRSPQAEGKETKLRKMYCADSAGSIRAYVADNDECERRRALDPTPSTTRSSSCSGMKKEAINSNLIRKSKRRRSLREKGEKIRPPTEQCIEGLEDMRIDD